MTTTLQPVQFLHVGGFQPMRGDFAPVRRTRSIGRFDIHDAEGHAPEIICRLMLGLCLAGALVQCFAQLANF